MVGLYLGAIVYPVACVYTRPYWLATLVGVVNLELQRCRNGHGLTRVGEVSRIYFSSVMNRSNTGVIQTYTVDGVARVLQIAQLYGV